MCSHGERVVNRDSVCSRLRPAGSAQLALPPQHSPPLVSPPGPFPHSEGLRLNLPSSIYTLILAHNTTPWA